MSHKDYFRVEAADLEKYAEGLEAIAESLILIEILQSLSKNDETLVPKQVRHLVNTFLDKNPEATIKAIAESLKRDALKMRTIAGE